MKREIWRIMGVLLVFLAVSVFVLGCGKRVEVEPVKPSEPVSIVEPVEQPWEPSQDWPGPADEELLTDTADDRELALREGRTSTPLNPVYYDFDRSDIRDDQVERINFNGNYMLDNSSVVVRIEGNTDERGTSEYNIALGERRAMSAKKYLVDMGVAPNRLQTVSYGKERPLALGSDEESWAINRRSDFLIVR